MIRIFHSHVPVHLDAAAFEARMARLPDDFHASILRYRRQSDRIRSLAAKLLLQKAADEFGLKAPLGFGVNAETGRPCFSQYPGFDFSLSHSGEVVVCAVSDNCRVGVDIEEIRPVNLDFFEISFSEREMLNLRKSEPPEPDFFKLWCAKEALSKANGKGLFLPFSRLEAAYGQNIVEGVSVCVRELHLREGYAAALAFEGLADKKVELRSVEF